MRSAEPHSRALQLPNLTNETTLPSLWNRMAIPIVIDFPRITTQRADIEGWIGYWRWKPNRHHTIWPITNTLEVRISLFTHLSASEEA